MNAAVRRAGVSAGGMAVHVDILTTLAEIDAIRGDWFRLYAEIDRPALFQSHSWCRAVVAALEAAGRKDPEPRVLVARRDGEVIGVLPLCVVSRLGIRVLRQLGEAISQYSDVLVRPGEEACLDAFIDAIGAMRDVDCVTLRRVRAGSPLNPVLNDAGAVRLNADVAPFTAFGTSRDPDAFVFAGAPKEFASTLKRRRKLGRTKGVTAHVLIGPEAREAAHAAIAMKRDWLAERDMTSAAFADPLWSGLMAELGMVDAPDMVGMVTVVEAEGTAIGYDLCYISAGRIYGHVGAFDQTRADLSPGRIAIIESMAYGLAQGVKGYDFLPPGDDYKFGWSTESEAVSDAILPLTTAGRVIGLTVEQRLKPWIKGNLDRLPASWRGALARLA